jgi:hypothetical protein
VIGTTPFNIFFFRSFRVDVHNQKQLNPVCKAVAFLASGALMHPAFKFHWQIESPWNKHMQYGPLCNIYFYMLLFFVKCVSTVPKQINLQALCRGKNNGFKAGEDTSARIRHASSY